MVTSDVLWQSCDNLVTLAPRSSWVCGAAKYPIGPTWHDSWHSWHHRVTVSCVTRHGDGWLTNMRCLCKLCLHHKNQFEDETVLNSFIFSFMLIFSLRSSMIASYKEIMRPNYWSLEKTNIWTIARCSNEWVFCIRQWVSGDGQGSWRAVK